MDKNSNFMWNKFHGISIDNGLSEKHTIQFYQYYCTSQICKCCVSKYACVYVYVRVCMRVCGCVKSSNTIPNLVGASNFTLEIIKVVTNFEFFVNYCKLSFKIAKIFINTMKYKLYTNINLKSSKSS